MCTPLPKKLAKRGKAHAHIVYINKTSMKKSIAAALIFMSATAGFAQSGTNSPYSQYGLGLLSDQSNSQSRGMNGLGLAFSYGDQINSLNPASYSKIDSLTMIFDVGIAGQLTNFQEGGRKMNDKNANFEYFTAAFRMFRHVGLSFGLVPYTNVGYKYSNTKNVNAFPSTSTTRTTYTNTYSGDGGLHQVYLGAGWEPVKGLSVGVNGSYLWGDINRTVTNSYSDSYVNTVSREYSASVRSYKVDFGAQYTQRVAKTDWVTLGLVYSFGHKLNSDPQVLSRSYNSQSGVADSATYILDNGLELPTTYGAGLMWDHNHQLRLGVDYTMQKWGSVSYPQYITENNVSRFELANGLFKDRHKVTLGVDYCRGDRDRRFLGRVHYRAGVSYATPYLKINGQDGPKEMSASLGFGIPFLHGYNSRQILNVSAQWVRQDSKTFIKENSFRINIGLTFDERWFAKFKME